MAALPFELDVTGSLIGSLVGALDGDANLMTEVNLVAAMSVPDGTAFRYIVVTPVTMTNLPSFAADIIEATIQIDVYSDKFEGLATPTRMTRAITDLIGRSEMSLTDWTNTTGVLISGPDVTIEEDALRHTMTYRFVTQRS